MCSEVRCQENLSLPRARMEDPKCNVVNSQGDSNNQPGSSRELPAIDKTIVREVFTELLSEILALKNLVNNSPSSSEGAVQLAAPSKDPEKQSSANSFIRSVEK